MGTDRRRATDILWISHTTPAAERALDLIAHEPDLTAADLRDRLGVSMGRTWQILNILQQPRVQRRRTPPPHRPRRRATPK